METYQFHLTTPSPLARNGDHARGFTLAEVLIAMFILTVGLTAMATLVAQSLGGTDRARYMGLATTLVSEKLEDLNRWPSADPHVGAGGSLSADSVSGSINYYDDVDLSNTNGYVSETIASTTGGVTTYTNVIHNATGYVNTAATTQPPAGSGIIAFHRRWLIEADPVVNGITLTGSRRVTVLVTLTNQAVEPAVVFQMSLLRP
jgi:prepilin-type N-terminal cleavage/methylation domain-containing protein